MDDAVGVFIVADLFIAAVSVFIAAVSVYV